MPHQEPGKRQWQCIAAETITALTDLTYDFASCRIWCVCQTSIRIHTCVGPGQSIQFCSSVCALAFHTLAKLHGLLTHCALAELQNPVDTVAVTMVQMLLLAPLVRLVRDGTTFCVFPLQLKPFLFIIWMQFLFVTLLVLCSTF